jgi:hypothetical protein
MAVDHIRYDLLAQEALRGVVRHVLADAAKNGLPGDHHFYISFDTGGEGVRISPRLREQYPDEITIILQHQFWDLSVSDEGFEVGLSFGGVPERLVVPFAAIKGFFDPSVQFGLQFETIEADAAEAVDDKTETQGPAISAVPPVLAQRSDQDAKPVADTPANEAQAGEPSVDKPMGEVVRLDRFRKK